MKHYKNLAALWRPMLPGSLALVAVLIATAAPTWAADRYWSGTGAWDTTTANWGNAPGTSSGSLWSNTAPDTAIFEGGGGTVTLGTAITAAELRFDGSGYTVTGNTLTLAGTPTITVATATAATVASSIAGSAGIAKLGPGSLTVSGAYGGTGGTIAVAAGTLVMAQTGFSGSSVGWGSGRNVSVSPAATLVLQQGWNGGSQRQVSIDGGTLSVTAGTASDGLNYVNDIVLENGAVMSGNRVRMGFYADGQVRAGGTTASSITGGLLLAQSSGNTRRLTFDVPDVTASTAADLTVSGAIGDLGGFAGLPVFKTGSGTLLLSGISTYTGATTVSAGTAVAGVGVTSTGGMSPAFGTGNVTVSAGATLTGATFFSVGGGRNTSNTRTIFLNGGTLDIDYAGPGAEYFRALDMTAGSVMSSGSGDVFRSPLAGFDIISRAAATSSTIATGIDLTASSLVLTVADGAAANDLVISGPITFGTTYGAALKSVAKTGPGTVLLSGSSTYNGGTTIEAGTVVAGHANALGSGAVTIEQGAWLRLAAGIGVANQSSFAGGGVLRQSTAGGGTVNGLVAGSTGAAVSLTPTATWSAGTPGTTYSDILALTGTSSTAQVLSLTYDPTGLDTAVIDTLGLGWRDPISSDWINAVAGNSSGTPEFFAGSWAEYLAANPTDTPTTALGIFGRDTATNTTWAVIDHNSSFAVIVVPEPGLAGTLVGAGLIGSLSLTLRRRGRETPSRSSMLVGDTPVLTGH